MKNYLIPIILSIILLNAFKGFAQKPNPYLEEVVVVFKTHFDIGYTDFAESVVAKYSSTMIEGALDNLEASRKLPKDKQFVWTMPAWPVKQILDRSEPRLRTRVENALKDGKFAIHALPFTLETEAGDLENLVRSFQFSADISKKFGLDLPYAAKMTDVPSHSWAIPTILNNAGIKFLHLGCNPASQSPELPDLFWWEGPDGSRLMTMYSEKYYGTDYGSPEGWPFKTWMALTVTNDNHGAPSEDEVKKTLLKIKELAPNARIRIGRMSDFYDLLSKENPELPVVRGDMPDTWIHGYMSMPKEMKVSRKIGKEIFALEALNTQLNNWIGRPRNISSMVKKASENSLLFIEHTWGMAMSHGESGYWAYGDEFKNLRSQGVYDPIEKSWKEKGNRIYDAEKTIAPTYKDELERLANSIDLPEKHITVYNELPWKRSGMVNIQIASGYFSGKVLKDLSNGQTLYYTNSGNEVRFKADNIPAMGYKTYILTDQEVNEEKISSLNEKSNSIENRFFKIEFDPEKGRIKSIIDKQTGKEMVNQGSEYGFGNYFYERFSKEQTENYTKDYVKAGFGWALAELGRPGLSDEPYRNSQGRNARISYQRDELKESTIMHFDRNSDLPHEFSLIVSLHKDQPYIEINWAIHGKPAEPWPEAGWLSFPFNVKNPHFKVGRLGAIVDPAKDFIKGSNHDYSFLNTGLAIVDDNGDGVAISSPDVPGVSLDRPGLWKYSEQFIPKKPNVFFNLYNNQWSTNFTEWVEGSWSTRFYLWSVNGYENEKDLITPSEELRRPLKAVFSYGSNGKLPVTNHGVSLSKKGVLLTAFRSDYDGTGTILRLWEQADSSGDCIVSLPAKSNFESVQQINLRGEIIGKPIAIKNERFNVKIEANKPYTFLLK